MRKVTGLWDKWTFALHPGVEEVTQKEMDALRFAPVTLPHDWAVGRPVNKDARQGGPQGYFDRWGTGFYRRELEIEKTPGMRYRLRFDGVYENCSVWVNGIPVGGWKYGYTPFVLDITEAAHGGANELFVRVDNTTIPVDRWYSGAGIYRMVWLESVPAEHLESEEITAVTSILPDGVRLTVKVEHAGRKRVTLRDSEKTWRHETTGDTVEFDDPALRLWSSQDPCLYELRVELLEGDEVKDSLSSRIGLRTVETDVERGLLVNGAPIKLKGVCLHQDGGCLGTAVSPEIWRERLSELKKLGCNALRLAHHLHMPEVLDLCDEMGFYVYEEAFDKWTAGAYGKFYEENWKTDLEAMVKRDRMRPSILIWGVGNEVENQAHPAMLRLLENHVAAVKALDGTRPVSLAMNPHFAYEERLDLKNVENIQQVVDEMKTGEILDVGEKIRRIKRIADRVDILSCNYMEQWYDDIHKVIPDKLVLGTETYQFFRGKDELFMAYNDQCPWLDVPARDWCIGGFVWSGIDYLGESAVWPSKGWTGALFTADMERRPMAWVYQSYWTEEPVVHFAVLDMSLADEGAKEPWEAPKFKHHWSFPQYQAAVVPYMVATNCDEVEIHIGDRSIRPGPTAKFKNRIVQGWLPYWPGKVTVVGFRNGVPVCRDIVVTPEAASVLRFDREEETVRLRRDEDGRGMPYQILCKVRAFDKNDDPVFHEYARVRFAVEGPAEILGTDNGDLCRAEPFTGPDVHLYGGHAAVALRVTGSGRVRVTAFAAGMLPASMVIAAQ